MVGTIGDYQVMQCGFAFLEAGSVRAKNTTNILMKNLLDVFLGAVAYWAFGYAFAFGDQSNSFIGFSNFFFINLPDTSLSFFFFHFVFAATAATIVSGAMAERTSFLGYMIYSVCITGFVYPVVSHWAWSGTGWLGAGPGNPNVGYQDFAGSSVVHMVGGTAALIGASVLGPRTGRFTNGSDFRGHTVPLVALGGFILFFGFFSFNGGSQASISSPGDGVVVANAITNTIICGAAAALVSLVLGKLVYGKMKWSLLVTINGGLTGMVAICAGCNSLYAWGAFATGIIAGAIFIGVSMLVEKAQIDDPLDAVADDFTLPPVSSQDEMTSLLPYLYPLKTRFLHSSLTCVLSRRDSFTLPLPVSSQDEIPSLFHYLCPLKTRFLTLPLPVSSQDRFLHSPLPVSSQDEIPSLFPYLSSQDEIPSLFHYLCPLKTRFLTLPLPVSSQDEIPSLFHYLCPLKTRFLHSSITCVFSRRDSFTLHLIVSS
ncbi:ammonium transporter-like protein [Apostichopus japonicus]|uniref:Ammonium transporter-like protein n=1 Tax=Stichopus japonicus TaxID=307972 RepID=A0A2G8JXT4_STIJA|nr:ammonium transporter-like protein [Apostichopus japonicus]